MVTIPLTSCVQWRYRRENFIKPPAPQMVENTGRNAASSPFG